jgi:hypothetical protein
VYHLCALSRRGLCEIRPGIPWDVSLATALGIPADRPWTSRLDLCGGLAVPAIAACIRGDSWGFFFAIRGDSKSRIAGYFSAIPACKWFQTLERHLVLGFILRPNWLLGFLE